MQWHVLEERFKSEPIKSRRLVVYLLCWFQRIKRWEKKCINLMSLEAFSPCGHFVYVKSLKYKMAVSHNTLDVFVLCCCVKTDRSAYLMGFRVRGSECHNVISVPVSLYGKTSSPTNSTPTFSSACRTSPSSKAPVPFRLAWLRIMLISVNSLRSCGVPSLLTSCVPTAGLNGCPESLLHRDSIPRCPNFCRLDGPGIESRRRQNFPHLLRPALESTHLPIPWIPRRFVGVKRPGLGFNHTSI
jgi:hypothetical protein